MPNWWFVGCSLEALAICGIVAYYFALRITLLEKNERIEDLQQQIVASYSQVKHFQSVNLMLAEKIAYRPPVTLPPAEEKKETPRHRKGVKWASARKQAEELTEN